jgi:hypothetical protein
MEEMMTISPAESRADIDGTLPFVRLTPELRESLTRRRLERRAGDNSKWIVSCDQDWRHNWQLTEIDGLQKTMETHLRESPGCMTVQLWRYTRRIAIEPAKAVVTLPTRLRDLDSDSTA